MKDTRDWTALSDRFVATLKPFAPPLALRFRGPGESPLAARFGMRYPLRNEHGRRGRVLAGCVFWIQGATDTFVTLAADSANRSVGRCTHGFITLEEAAATDDVGAVLEATVELQRELASYASADANTVRVSR